MSLNCKLKNKTFNIAINPEKKNKLSIVDLTNFLFFIPLPRTWDLNKRETINQNPINKEFKYVQEVYVKNSINSVDNNITKNSPK